MYPICVRHVQLQLYAYYNILLLPHLLAIILLNVYLRLITYLKV